MTSKSPVQCGILVYVCMTIDIWRYLLYVFSVLYVTVSHWHWCLIHGSYESCPALGTGQDILYHGGDMVQKVIAGIYMHYRSIFYIFSTV